MPLVAPASCVRLRLIARTGAGRGAGALETQPFAGKLTLVLKALAISRGRLAADLGIDKSVVSRWCSGVNIPSGENLSALTRLVTARAPGFTGLDWDRDLASLDALFGGRAPAMAVQDEPASLPGALAEWLSGRALGDAMASSAAATAACAGFWRITQPSIVLPPMFFHQYMIMAPDAAGLLKFRVGYFDVRFEGWAFAVRNQLYFCGSDVLRGNQLYGIYNLPSAERADLLEGIALTCLPDVGGMPGSQLCVFERIGDLSGDADADLQRYTELSQQSPMATEASAPADIRSFLGRHGIGPTINPATLTLPYVDSISHGAGWDEAVAINRRLPPARPPAAAPAAETPAAALPLTADTAAPPMMSLPFGLVETAEKQTARRGGAYHGRWQVTRLSATGKLVFVVEHVLIRPQGAGLWIEHHASGHRLEGWLLILNNRLYGMLADETDDSFATYLLNGVVGPRADRMDGLLTSVGSERNSDPFAMVVVLERVGALQGSAADTAWAQTAVPGAVDAAQVPDEIRAALCRDFGPGAAANGGDAILRIPFERSLAKGQLQTAG